MKFDRSACIEPMYSEIPFLDRFQAAKDDGFEYVEFWSWTDKDLDAVKAAAEKAGIGISGFNGDADYSLIDPTLFSQITRVNSIYALWCVYDKTFITSI